VRPERDKGCCDYQRKQEGRDQGNAIHRPSVHGVHLFLGQDVSMNTLKAPPSAQFDDIISSAERDDRRIS
jgi:hypothetical protein